MEQPSFFKILLEPSAPHLFLPPTFVSKHLKNKIPKNPVLKSPKGGYSWKLKISRIGENYGFTHGWNSVVEDNKLGYGDFLVFKLVDESTFRFSIFGPNGCVKDFCVQDFPKKVKVEEEERADFDFDDDGDGIVEEGDSEDEIDNEEDEYEKEDDVDDESEEEEDDVDDESEEEDDVDVDDDDEDGDDGIDGNDGDPFFTTTISKSKTQQSYLRLPSEFVYLAGIGGENNIILKNLDDQEWLMELKSDMKNYHMSSGWKDFKRSNELLEGDECVFKFIKSEGKLALVKVIKKKPWRWQTLPPPPPMEKSPETKERPRRRQTLPPTPPVEKSPATKERPQRLPTLPPPPPPPVEKSNSTRGTRGRWSVDVERENDGAEVVRRQPEKTPVKKPKINEDDDKDDDDINDNVDDPFFTITFKKWHEKYVRFPTEFVKSNGLHERKPIIIKDLDQQEWKFELTKSDGKNFKFTTGWTDFRRKNNLSEGNIYMFKYIKSECKLSLVKVSEIKKP